MNRTIKDATDQTPLLPRTHDQLHVHLRDFVDASKLSGASPHRLQRLDVTASAIQTQSVPANAETKPNGKSNCKEDALR